MSNYLKQNYKLTMFIESILVLTVIVKKCSQLLTYHFFLINSNLTSAAIPVEAQILKMFCAFILETGHYFMKFQFQDIGHLGQVSNQTLDKSSQFTDNPGKNQICSKCIHCSFIVNGEKDLSNLLPLYHSLLYIYNRDLPLN